MRCFKKGGFVFYLSIIVIIIMTSIFFSSKKKKKVVREKTEVEEDVQSFDMVNNLHKGHKNPKMCTPNQYIGKQHKLDENDLIKFEDIPYYHSKDSKIQCFDESSIEQFLLVNERFMYGYPNAIGQTANCDDGELITWCNRFVLEILFLNDLLRPAFMSKNPRGVCDSQYTKAENLIKNLNSCVETFFDVRLVSKVKTLHNIVWSDDYFYLATQFLQSPKHSHVAIYLQNCIIGAGSKQSFGKLSHKQSKWFDFTKEECDIFCLLTTKGARKLLSNAQWSGNSAFKPGPPSGIKFNNVPKNVIIPNYSELGVKTKATLNIKATALAAKG